MSNYLIDSMKGLGDNIFQRHIVKALCNSGNNVWINTPWPEIYKDLKSVFFVKRETQLRTQKKNMERASESIWHDSYPKDCRVINLHYGHRDLSIGSIIKSMESKAGFKFSVVDFDLSSYGGLPSIVRNGGKPVAIVRPVTVRNEWSNPARNPMPEYICVASKILKENGYWVVSVADLEDGKEWVVGETPFAHQRFHKGELAISELLGLVEGSNVVVGGVGWVVPACIALKTPLFCILGGQGAHNSPGVITDRRMDLSTIRFATPDNHCRCSSMKHNCNKTISNLNYSLRRFLKHYE